jgi:hypothetical protein
MKFKFAVFSLIISANAFAGVDLSSTVERIKINGDGKLWLKMTSATFDQYCKNGWYGFNLYIPTSDPSYPYYFGLVTTALTKNLSLYIANISSFNGTTSCDLTKTGYGIVLKKAS